MTDDTQAAETRRTAQQLAVAAAEHEERGNTESAERAQRRAEKAFEEAGLDPAWHDETALVAAEDSDGPPVRWFELNGRWVELTENPDPNAPVEGLVVKPDAVAPVVR